MVQNWEEWDDQIAAAEQSQLRWDPDSGQLPPWKHMLPPWHMPTSGTRSQHTPQMPVSVVLGRIAVFQHAPCRAHCRLAL